MARYIDDLEPFAFAIMDPAAGGVQRPCGLWFMRILTTGALVFHSEHGHVQRLRVDTDFSLG